MSLVPTLTVCEAYLTSPFGHPNRPLEGIVEIVQVFDERGRVDTSLNVHVPGALVCDCREAHLIAILRIVVTDIEAVVFGEGEKALHGLQRAGISFRN